MNTVEIHDANGVPIKVGMRVLNELEVEDGTVSKIGPLEDESGRPEGNDMYVHVSYDSGADDHFVCHWSASGLESMDAPFVCAGVVVSES